MNLGRPRCISLAALAVGASLLGLLAAAASGQMLRERADVLVVEIPVWVEKDRQPVRGLEASDFKVLDGRKRRQIVDFEVIDLGRRVEQLGDGRPDLPLAAARKFVLLFDLTFSRPAGIARARHAALDLVDRGMTPFDLVAVATYARTSGARAVTGFTTDRDVLRAAIDSLGLYAPPESFVDPLAPLLGDLRAAFGAAASNPSETRSPAGFDRRALADEIFLENLLDLAPFVNRANRQALEDEVLGMTDAYADLARLLDRVDGTKQIVLFSEGFDGALLRGTDDRRRSAQMAELSARGQVWQVDSEERFGTSTARSALYATLDELRRAGCVVHTVDSGGLASAGGAGHDTLYLMADETGGVFFRNLNDLTVAVDRLLAASSYSYLLVIQPEGVALDGAFHKLEVKLENRIRGARIVHRPGYYARVAAF